jgi:flagellar L-ring protein precursor FlgH
MKQANRAADGKSALMTCRLLKALATVILVASGTFLPAQTSEESIAAYIEESRRATQVYGPSQGSLYSANSYLAETARDPRAATIGDLVTIRVSEQASALASGSTQASRDNERDYSIASLLGQPAALGALTNLLGSSGSRSLQGQGSTSRSTNVTATITVRVTHVMPNGNLIIEGAKDIAINSEHQQVWLRGAVRQADLQPDNSVTSDRVAMMDLRVNGKGVVNASIKRPNILARIIGHVLPF